jgi:hypothetical protein
MSEWKKAWKRAWKDADQDSLGLRVDGKRVEAV